MCCGCCNRRRQCCKENSCAQNYNYYGNNCQYPCYQAQNYSNVPLYNSGSFFSSPYSNFASSNFSNSLPFSNFAGSSYFPAFPNYSAFPNFPQAPKFHSPPPLIPNIVHSPFKPLITKQTIQPVQPLPSFPPRYKRNGC
jgi:hypothetical protein